MKHLVHPPVASRSRFAGFASLAATAAAALVLGGTPAQVSAGLVLEQVVESTEATSNTVMRLQNGKIRTDIDEDVTTIADTQTREVMTLIHAVRQMLRATPAGEAEPTATTAALPLPKYTVTGQTEVINGHLCDIITMEFLGLKSTYWVARDYPEYDKIKAELAALKRPVVSATSAAAVPEEMKGLALKTTTVSRDYASTTVLKSVKLENIEDSVFLAPEGYREEKEKAAD